MNLSEFFQAVGAGCEIVEKRNHQRKMIILRNISAVKDEYERLVYWLDQLEKSLKEGDS